MSNKQVEKDQQQGKGKVRVVPQDRRDFMSERYNNNRPKRDFAGHPRSTVVQWVNTVFQEPVHQILDKIKNELYFRWPNKMGGDPTKRNQSLIVSITKIEDTLRKSVGIYGIISSS